jgi:DNA repair protein RadC
MATEGRSVYVRELVVFYRRRPTVVASGGLSMKCPRDAAAMFASLLEDEPVEVFGVLLLTTKQALIAYHELSRGSIDTTVAHPRELFKVALLANAAAVIVGHNHPSGDPSPSPDDRALTHRIVQAGELMGMEVLDHIIVGHDGRYFSFREAGEVFTCR